ncbi:uncharacterized protein LOC128679763 [Plodia interpunctella]|uniref:uncharacterized protein LOC128679763 n=1 Tax=Plodia interpunctella TaxID=58824 RepID=UPI002368EE97|nr:uncharacterized protein LOC128679763 [Plodia interpunctella]
MKLATVIVLACFVAVAASARHEHYPAEDALPEEAVQEATLDTAQENLRPKRSLLLLKKKLILGALGLKAAKAAAVGAIVLKSKPKSVHHEIHIANGHPIHPIHPTWGLEVHRFG